MFPDAAETQRVASALKVLDDRIEQILFQGKQTGKLHGVTEAQLKVQTASLKQDIKNANKYGTINGAREPASETERMFYSKAIQDASSNFTLRPNISPSNPKWRSGLVAVQNEIRYHLHRLRMTTMPIQQL
jgi:hypothetical protein